MLLTLILTSLFMTVAFTFILYPFAIKIGFTDRPCHRKQHKSPTPLVGGLAIYLAILTVMLINNDIISQQYEYIAASTILVGVGLVDDYKGLSVKLRLAAQIFAALIMTESSDLRIVELGDLLAFGNINLGYLATPFTVFAVVGGINAFNMIDGIDGLAGGLTLISIAAITIIAAYFQDFPLLVFCSIFMAALVGFLLFNLRIFGRASAKIFLGDTGSTLCGFTVCWMVIHVTQGETQLVSPFLALWIIAVPLIDSVCIMFRRISKGCSPFAADREHLHHILTLAGYSINEVLIRLLLFAFIISFTGVSVEIGFQFPDELMFACFLILFAAYYWGMSHAWTMMKIARYLRTNQEGATKRSVDRRQAERRVASVKVDLDRRMSTCRRVTPDRRYVPTEDQLLKIYNRGSKRKDTEKSLDSGSVAFTRLR